MADGKAFTFFVEEVRGALSRARETDRLEPYVDRLDRALTRLVEVTETLTSRAASNGTAVYLADATLYLEYFSLVTVAWQWLLQMIAADQRLSANLSKSEKRFYEGKWHTGRYYFHYELPKTRH